MQRLAFTLISCIYKYKFTFNICPTGATMWMDFLQVQVALTVVCLSVVSYVSSIIFVYLKHSAENRSNR